MNVISLTDIKEKVKRIGVCLTFVEVLYGRVLWVDLGVTDFFFQGYMSSTSYW